jgi:hypothetical protein
MRIAVAGRQRDPSGLQFVSTIDPSNRSRLNTSQSGRSVEKSSWSNRRASMRPLSVKATDFAFSPWIGNESLFVQTVHDLPIEALPGSIDVMKPQIQQGQNGPVDLVIVKSHSCLANASE